MEPGWREVLPPPAPTPGSGEDEETACSRRSYRGRATRAASRRRSSGRRARERGDEAAAAAQRGASPLADGERRQVARGRRPRGGCSTTRASARPATRADVIENLIAKGYAVRLGKALRPTVKGIRLIDTLRRVHIDRLASPELTGEIEQHLDRGRAAAGDSAEDFIDEMSRLRPGDRRQRADASSTTRSTVGSRRSGPAPPAAATCTSRPGSTAARRSPTRDPDCAVPHLEGHLGPLPGPRGRRRAAARRPEREPRRLHRPRRPDLPAATSSSTARR